jgi:Mn2+/Fe2+ NRAMP family transporter
MATNNDTDTSFVLPPPRSLAILAAMGPGLVWCGEYIGSGEVILATRNGAIFGVSILWVPFLAIFAKYWIGLAGAHYTVTTGEGMIDMMSRTPGPKNWVIWPVFIAQICSGLVATSALATVTGAFLHYFFPINTAILSAIAVIVVIALSWSGMFEPLKRVMSLLVLLIILGTVVVAFRTWPGIGEILAGMFGFQIPDIPEWARASVKHPTAWGEILPLLGWAAGGFASQVWYTYWVIGAGYGMTRGRGCGVPFDRDQLMAVTVDDAQRIRGWRKVVTYDATLALVIGVSVTAAFMIAGSGVLRPKQIVPEQGPAVAMTLSTLFGEQWGVWGAHMFILAGLAAMLSTLLGQFAGWPRLLSDCARILFPGKITWPWKRQVQFVLVAYGIVNMAIIFYFSKSPVLLVKTGAILDGLLLTPLQAIVVIVSLYFLMPTYFRPEVRPLIRANKLMLPGLILALVIFTYFCVVQIPQEFSGQ